MDQGEHKNHNSNNDERNRKKGPITNIPIINVIITTAAIGYLTYLEIKKVPEHINTLKKWKKKFIGDNHTVNESGPYTVQLFEHYFELTPREYQEYKKCWFKWDFYVNNLRRLLDCGRAWDIYSSKPIRPKPQPQISNAPQRQSEPKQPSESQVKPEQKLEAPPEVPQVEEKYLIVHEHFRNDLPELQKNNQKLRCWIEKNINPNEVPDRYKTDISTLSNDVFAVHEFNLQELNDYIKEHNLDPKAWERLYGNEIQRALHRDSIQLLEQSRNPFKSWLQEYKEDLIKTIDAGRALNELGYCSKATKVNNFCSSLMHYGNVAQEGVVNGAISRTPTNPWAIGATIGVITAAVLVPGVAEALLVYNILQCSYEFGQTLGLLICKDDPRAQKELNEKFEPFKQRFKDSYGWEDTLYDAAHVTGELGGDIVVAKASKTVAKCVGKVVDVVSKFPKKPQGEVVATTPDGQKIKVPDESKNQNTQRTATEKNVGRQIAKEIKQAARTIDDLLKECAPWDKQKGSTKQYTKMGSFQDALNDFKSLSPINITDASDADKVCFYGYLCDGKTVIARNISKKLGPTLEIQYPNSNKTIKIRYS